MKRQKRTYEYYSVNVPSDCTDDAQERATIAFAQAEQMTRLYCVPCEWTILKDDGETVLVRRVRAKMTRTQCSESDCLADLED